jgi:diguanylate cyclase (GGDEF)-like protein/PAS domain S-box-containing protein
MRTFRRLVASSLRDTRDARLVHLRSEIITMATTPGRDLPPVMPMAPGPSSTAQADHWEAELGTLLRELQELSSADGAPSPAPADEVDNQLVQVRLGIASSLFTMLQLKHPATARHSLRVALTTSAWAARMGLSPLDRDHIELAALLHDVGMIGVPDRILAKPTKLDANERLLVLGARRMSQQVLRHSCAAAEILQIVEHVADWYNGKGRPESPGAGKIPLGSRMIAIAEAFDAMISDQVYRRARPLEAAIAELFECAGSQFDPALVRQFAEYHLQDQSSLHEEVAGRWLRSLDPALVNSYWRLNGVASPGECCGEPGGVRSLDSLFRAKLLDNMYDAAIFVDAAQQVIAWNHGAERLTGVSAHGIRQHSWRPELLAMRDEKGRAVKGADCPIHAALHSGVQSLRRLTISGRSGREIAVDTHTIPVVGEQGIVQGAILVMHDASSETSLEQRCQNLHEKATKDGLTQVANRAEFDRVHKMFIDAHLQQKAPCSIIICDIDHFKQVNDTFGHQAGDEAIKGLAALLKNACHAGDLVARYGGEEFVMLCADCDNATAARRAEQVRKAISELSHPRLDGHAITVSFGVTEVQPGDTAETMLRRADRGLLMAKSRGRNQVVQLGSGAVAPVEAVKTSFWSRKPAVPLLLREQDLLTAVPLKIAVEKLRGFVADHQAHIVSLEGNQVRLEITDSLEGRQRRWSDRPVTFVLDVRLEEEQHQRGADEANKGGILRTRIHVAINPRKNRDRRRADVDNRAKEVLVSLRSYLMASVAEAHADPADALSAAKPLETPWLEKRD